MRSPFLASILLPALLLSACATDSTTTQDTNEPSPAVSDDSSEPQIDTSDATLAAREHLAARLGVEVDDIIVQFAEPRDWSDGCLGLGGPAESCLAAMTPGYAVTLEHGGTAYRYRTNLDGTAVRMETDE